MFQAIMLIFRRSHYCIHAAYGIITQESGQLLLKHNFNLLLQSVVIRSEKLKSCRKI